jgi:hypothetical protein
MIDQQFAISRRFDRLPSRAWRALSNAEDKGPLRRRASWWSALRTVHENVPERPMMSQNSAFFFQPAVSDQSPRWPDLHFFSLRLRAFARDISFFSEKNT